MINPLYILYFSTNLEFYGKYVYMLPGHHRIQLSSQNSRLPDLAPRYIGLSYTQSVSILPIDCEKWYYAYHLHAFGQITKMTKEFDLRS